jgi:hypothetical protein
MRQRWLKSVLFVLSVLLIAVLAAGATKTPPRKLKHVSGPITTLAMDGARVVYSTDFNGVYVWNVRSGATARMRRPSGSDFPLVQEVAIAGQRVAWIERDVAGNSEETNEDLYTASTGRRRVKKLAHAYRIHEFDLDGTQRWDGDWIGGLAGSGRLLVVSRWTTRPTPGGPNFEEIVSGSLSLISPAGGRLHPLVAGVQSVVSSSVDAGRIAVLRHDGSVGIYSAAGALLRQIMPSSAQEIALGGGHLVVLTKTKTLEVYKAQSGALEHSWPIKTTRAYLQVGHLQAYGRIAVFVVDPRYSNHNLTIFDLKTGKRLFLPWQPRSRWNDATVGSLSIVYADSHRASGTLVFLPTARVLAAFARGHL